LEGLEYQKEVGLLKFQPDMAGDVHLFNGSDSWPIWRTDDQGRSVPEQANSGPYMPTWQTSPVFHQGNDVNQNLLMSPLRKGLNDSYHTASVVIGEFVFAEPGDVISSNPETAMMSLLLSSARNEPVEYAGDPMSHIFFPIFDSFRSDRTPVAVMSAWIHWMSYFKYILPSTLSGINVVLHDSCSGAFTYEITGENAQPIGRGDLHDGRFDNMKRSASFDAVSNIGDGTKHGLPLNKELCLISIDVYPSQLFYSQYKTPTPIIMTIAVAMIFVFTACMFVFYNRFVEWRQALVMHKALQTNAIVASMFPANVRDRLMDQTPGPKMTRDGRFDIRWLSKYVDEAADSGVQAPPIADLFPNCTVLFADIAGFTAWSSTRDPEQVFVLLQTVYQSFDRIAKRRKVFKVETVRSPMCSALLPLLKKLC
jgi:Adenylate and Guanylate cyclase catalytic domain